MIPLPSGWPKMTLAEIEARMTATGQRFEVEEVSIRGVPTRVWKNAPPSLPALARHARNHGERLAMIYEDERVTYEASFRATAVLALELARSGVAKGDRVAIAMANLPEWPVAFFAITSLGAIAVPLNAWWTGPELQYGLVDSGAKVLICDGPRFHRLEPHIGSLPALEHVIVSRSAEPMGHARRLEDIFGPAGDWARLPEHDLPDVAIGKDDDATIF